MGSSNPPSRMYADSIPGCVWRATATPGSISASTSSVTYPGAGPSICDKIFRVTPGVVAGGVPWADTSVATKSVIPQIAHDATAANPRRVSMATSLRVSGLSAPALFLWPRDRAHCHRPGDGAPDRLHDP